MASADRRQYEAWGLSALLARYSGLSIRPHRGSGVLIAGQLAFEARPDGYEPIEGVYEISLLVPERFPRELPAVKSLDGRVPADYHTNDDSTLCLGSPVRLHLAVHQAPTLIGFVEQCVVPFLYGRTYFERHGKVPFGELAHGDDGLLQDYAALLGVRSERGCVEMLRLMAMRKRLANKRPCPCGSGRRVGRCHNRILNSLRDRLGRPWFRSAHAYWSLQVLRNRQTVVDDGRGQIAHSSAASRK